MGCELSKLGRRSRLYRPGDNQTSLDQTQQAAAAPPTSKKHKGSVGSQTDTAGLIKTCPEAAQPVPKAKLDPKNFMFMQLTSETQVKLPGTINAQQFIIDGCQDCNLYVMDACAMVTIDDCKNCRIFIGPTESSIFMRDCSNCKLACITRQLRTRGCHGCNILLYTRTRPIIESSTAIGLGCYSTPYAGLAQQMVLAQLSPFHNFWSDVFDFTPDDSCPPAAEKQTSKHWHLLPARVSLQEHMGCVPDQVLQLLPRQVGSHTAPTVKAALEQTGTSTVAAAPCEADLQAVLCTAGQLCDVQQIADGSFAFLLFPPGQEAAVQQLLAAQCFCTVSECQSSRGSSSTSTTVVAAPESTVVTVTLAPDDKEVVADVEDVTLNAINSTLEADANCSSQPSAAAQLLHVSNATSNVKTAAAGDHLQPLQQQQQLLLRANKAAIPGNVLQSMATAAGWTQAQLKQLKAADAAAGNSKQKHTYCIGLELLCSSLEHQETVCAQAAKLGALTCKSLKVALLFRNLGTDG